MERIKIISEKISEAKPVLNLCGIKQTSIAFNGKKIEALDDKQFQELIRWFTKFEFYIANYRTQRALVSEERWEAYKRFQIVGLQEQVLLSKAKNLIIAEWKSRPESLQRVSNAK